MEEKRSVHSLHSLHSLRSSRSHPGNRPLSDISYIDEDVKTPSPNDYPYDLQSSAKNAVANTNTTTTTTKPVSSPNNAESISPNHESDPHVPSETVPLMGRQTHPNGTTSTAVSNLATSSSSSSSTSSTSNPNFVNTTTTATSKLNNNDNLIVDPPKVHETSI